MASSNDWDLQAVVRSCATAAGSSEAAEAPPAPARPRREEAPRESNFGGRAAAALEFLGQPPVQRPAASLRDLDLDHELPRAPFTITSSSERSMEALDHEAFIAFPAASTSGQQPRKQTGRKPAGVRTPRPKRSKKSQLKKVVCEVPAADGGVSTDLWAWRKYGQKPIKGSPYPRGYYKCSSLKACMARKLVERSPADPAVLIVTYIAEHCHSVPTMLSALAGTTRHRPASPDQQPSQSQSHGASDEAASGADASSMTVDGGGSAETPDVEDELWPVEMALDEYPLLDDFDFLGPFDDDLNRFFGDEEGVLGRRLSL